MLLALLALAAQTQLSVCDAAALASRTSLWTYTVGKDVDCVAQHAFRPPKKARADADWFIDAVVAQGLIVVETKQGSRVEKPTKALGERLLAARTCKGTRATVFGADDGTAKWTLPDDGCVKRAAQGGGWIPGAAVTFALSGEPAAVAVEPKFVREGVRATRRRLFECFARELPDEAGFGRMKWVATIQWDVDKGGQATNVTAVGGTAPDDVVECLVDRIQGVQFPLGEHKPGRVQYTFRLTVDDGQLEGAEDTALP